MRRRAPSDGGGGWLGAAGAESTDSGSDSDPDPDDDAAGSGSGSESDSGSDAAAGGLEDVPFGELIAMKRNGSAAGYDRAAAERSEAQLHRAASARGERGRSKAKKAHKSRPLEVTSKKPVSRHREVVNLPGARRRASRDPRFDAMSGSYEEERFSRAYDFLDGYREKETAELKAALKKTKKEKQRKKIQVEISRLASQSQVQQGRLEAARRKAELKQVGRELVRQGHKPFYFKKSELKKVELAAKYKELKKAGGTAKVDRAIEKKRKRNANRAHKFVPYERRGDG